MMNAEICRICRNENNLKYIVGETLLDKLKICANITINYNDCLPKYICQQCEKALDFSYRLRKQSEETEKRLLEEQLQMEEEQQYQQQPEVDEEYLEEVEYEILHADNESNEIIEEMPVVKTTSSPEQQDYLNEKTFEDEKSPSEENYNYMSEVYLEEEDESAEISEKKEEFFVDKNLTVENKEADLIVLKTWSFDMIAKDNSDSSEVRLVKKTYTCATCQLELSNQTEYRQHIKQHENVPFDCIQCMKSFPTHFRLKQHEKCHAVEVKLHQCTHCAKNFRIRHNLVRHIRVAHELQRPYACALCTESFGRADVLKNHLVTHVEEKNFQCDMCLECFKSQRYLDSHLRTHLPKQTKLPQKSRKKPNNSGDGGGGDVSNKKLYYCPYCGKSSKHHFTHANHLRTHTQERPYACGICAKKFRTMAAKLTHERIHSDAKPYQCELCLTSFRQPSHLKEHRMIHDGIMPHTCNVCNMSFTKKSNMRVHMRVHTGERPYECADCAQKFTKLSILKRHKAKLHDGGGSSMRKDYVGVNIIDEEEVKVEEFENEELEEGELAEEKIVKVNGTTAVKSAVHLQTNNELSNINEFNTSDDTSVVLIDNGDDIMN